MVPNSILQGAGQSYLVFHIPVSKVSVRTDLVCNIIVIRGVATLVFHHPIYGVRFCYNGPHQTTPTRYILGFKNYPNRVIANAERTPETQTNPAHQVVMLPRRAGWFGALILSSVSSL